MGWVKSLPKLQGRINEHPFDGDDVSYRLADEVLDYVESAKRDDVSSVIDERKLGKDAYSAWTAPQASQYFLEELARRRAPKPASAQDFVSPFEKLGTAEFVFACANALSPAFLVSRKEDGTLPVFEITDRSRREVRSLSPKPADRRAAMGRVLSPYLEADGVGITPKLAAAAELAYITHAPVLPVPVLLGQPGEDNWCLRRRIHEPQAGEFPHLRQLTDRFNDDCAYGAYIWGVVSGKNKGRQILYISDLRGEGAKSRAIGGLLEEIFGSTIYTSFPASKLAADNPHASAHFIGKKLVVCGDNKNPWLLHTGMLKQLSGDDSSFVNPKYELPSSVRFECRVIVLSNTPPAIVRDVHNTSRTLWLTLKPLMLPDAQRDPYYLDKCIKELPQFLAWCEQCYKERCGNDYAIQVNDKVKRAVQLRIAETETYFAVPFAEFFVLDAAGSLTAREWTSAVREMKLDNHKADNFRDWLLTAYPSVCAMATADGDANGWYLQGVRRRTGRDHWSSGPTHHAPEPAPAPADDIWAGEDEEVRTNLHHMRAV